MCYHLLINVPTEFFWIFNLSMDMLRFPPIKTADFLIVKYIFFKLKQNFCQLGNNAFRIFHARKSCRPLQASDWVRDGQPLPLGPQQQERRAAVSYNLFRVALTSAVELASDRQPLPLGPKQQERRTALSILYLGALTTAVVLAAGLGLWELSNKKGEQR